MAIIGPAGGNLLDVKSHNVSALLRAILRHQPISRVRLARLLGLSTTTVTNLVAELVEQGLVSEDGTDVLAMSSGAGRLPRALRFVDDSRYGLGVFIGVRRVRLILGNLAGRLVDGAMLDHVPGEAPAQTVERIAAMAGPLLARNGLRAGDERLVGVGVGASGLVANDTGVNLLAPVLGWRDVPLQRLLSEALDLPVAVDNNVRSMALAESMYGAGRDVRALIFLYAQVGVGAGLVVDGAVYRGADYGAGEIGHWTIIPDGGAPCRCGNTGCLETLISEPALVELAAQVRPELRDAGPNPLQALLAAARGGDEELRRVLAERSRYLGIALANLVNVLNPELILLGGLLHQGFDLFQPVVEPVMKERSFATLGRRVQLLPASFGERSGEVGAVALALNTFLFQQAGA
ncbi:MAG TPA: ROK family transcriptional regulator [Chloroflexaceae bacterium]|nr:ROK family transcriptional regulator [Chloroflexaceae bacterium]